MKKYFSKEKWKYLLYTMSHPVDGYYEIRHRGEGSVPVAIVLVILFSFSFSINRMSASFVVNNVDPRNVDSFYELTSVLLLYALFCVGNWSITSLMGGEGRLKDIAIAIGYALMPLIIAYNVGTLLSQVIAADEEAFYGIVIALGIAFSGVMMLIGIMQVHNYSLGKTLVTLVLSFISVLLIIFILLLLADLVNQVINFFYSIYLELIFRT